MGKATAARQEPGKSLPQRYPETGTAGTEQVILYCVIARNDSWERIKVMVRVMLTPHSYLSHRERGLLFVFPVKTGIQEFMNFFITSGYFYLFPTNFIGFPNTSNKSLYYSLKDFAVFFPIILGGPALVHTDSWYDS
jgi:hypothetical protein